MIDWHCHILPGIDDGAVDQEQSLAMARLLVSAGFTEVYCTPHLMRGCYEVGNDFVRQVTADLQDRLDELNIAVQLRPSREYCLDEYLLAYLEDPLPLGDGRSILVEIPPRITADLVRQLMYSVIRAGFTPVIAHPERCQLLEPAVRRTARRGIMGTLKKMFSGEAYSRQEHDSLRSTGNALLDYLSDLGCGFQGNLGSFSGFYGPQVKTVAQALHSRGVYDRFGSDLHAPEHAGRVLHSLPQ